MVGVFSHGRKTLIPSKKKQKMFVHLVYATQTENKLRV
jgi:hypothetical protein